MDILLGWLSIFLWTRPNAYMTNKKLDMIFELKNNKINAYNIRLMTLPEKGIQKVCLYSLYYTENLNYIDAIG